MQFAWAKGEYRPTSPPPVKREETAVLAVPLAAVKEEEEWLDSSQLDDRPSPPPYRPPPYPSQAELRQLAGKLIDRIEEMRASEPPQPHPPTPQVGANEGGVHNPPLIVVEDTHAPTEESHANPWELPTWTSLLSLLDDLTRPSLEWLSEAEDVNWLVPDAPNSMSAPPAGVTGTPSPAMGDVNGEEEQREGGTPGRTVNEHRTTLGGEKKRGEKRQREETENAQPEDVDLWAYSVEEESKKKVKIQVTFEVTRDLWGKGDTEVRVSVGQGIYDGLLYFWRHEQAKRRRDEFVEWCSKA